MSEFQTNKTNLASSRIVETNTAPIAAGEVLVKVDKYAFTANNITYAVMGDRLRYWEFFPPQGDNPEQWGIIPVWGFADVVESQSNEVPVGERLFGYFPPANELVMTPSKVSPTSFLESTAHRASLPPTYNLYQRVNADASYDRATDNERILLFVLHLTSFCIHDSLQSNDWFGARQIVIISASSKTSTGLAYGLDDDNNAPAVIGLTSPRNTELVNSLGVYDSTHTYDDLTNIDASVPTVIVDMSGDTRVLSRLHRHLGDDMRFCSNVGLTHWDEPQVVDGIIQERSEMFFAPGHIQQRIKEWGHEEFDKKSRRYVAKTSARSRSWMKMRELEGLEDLAKIYNDVCNGKIAPDEGLIVKM